jgi:hypothetical protein
VSEETKERLPGLAPVHSRAGPLDDVFYIDRLR